MPDLDYPAVHTNHGVTEVYVFVDMDTTYYKAVCKRHYTDSGYQFERDPKGAEAWKCPRCVVEYAEFEKATRDD